MKMEVLENGNIVLDEVTLKNSLINRLKSFKNCQWCELDECIEDAEKYMGMIIDQNEHDEISDCNAIEMIRYFRKIKAILLDLKPE